MFFFDVKFDVFWRKIGPYGLPEFSSEKQICLWESFVVVVCVTQSCRSYHQIIDHLSHIECTVIATSSIRIRSPVFFFDRGLMADTFLPKAPKIFICAVCSSLEQLLFFLSNVRSYSFWWKMKLWCRNKRNAKHKLSYVVSFNLTKRAETQLRTYENKNWLKEQWMNGIPQIQFTKSSYSITTYH